METLTFGKYKGCRLEDIPTSYLDWLVEKSDIVKNNAILREKIQDILIERYEERLYREIKRMQREVL